MHDIAGTSSNVLDWLREILYDLRKSVDILVLYLALVFISLFALLESFLLVYFLCLPFELRLTVFITAVAFVTFDFCS